MEKITRKRVCKTLKFSEIYSDRTGEFVGGGLVTSGDRDGHIRDEVYVDIHDDPVRDDETDEEFLSGRIQLHVGGTRRAFEELGTFFLGLAHYRPPKAGYSRSFELTDIQGNPAVHLVVHLPDDEPSERKAFSTIHVGGSLLIYEDGATVVTTPRRPEGGEQPFRWGIRDYDPRDR